jgi:hypothetical protein
MEPFINKTMLGSFSRFGWTLQNNKVEGDGGLDPMFAMGALPDDAYTYQFMEAAARRRPSLQTGGYPWALGWWPNGATKGEFIWPLPFNLKPTNPDLIKGDDGFPIGDLNWYGSQVLADWYNSHTTVAVTKRDKAGLNIRNYPNPVRSSTQIMYSLPKEGKVRLVVYNALGNVVTSLVNASQSAGEHRVNFNVENLPGGVYYYKIQVGTSVATQKMMVVK